MNEERTARRGQSLSGAVINAYVSGRDVVAHRQENRPTPGSSARIATNAARSGRALPALLLGLAIVGVVAWMLLGGDDGSAAHEAISPLPGVSEEESSTGASSSSVNRSAPLQDAPVAEFTTADGQRAEKGTLPKFYGRGSIRGLVSVASGVTLPPEFTLHIGPSDSLFGREHAESRSQVTTEAEFVFEDIPLGGYDVWVAAPGMNSRRNPVLLTQAVPSPYVVLKVAPTGFVDGYVVNKDGRPAAELRVALDAVHSDQRIETQTRQDGFYVFDDVPDGEYQISFGPLDAPLVPPRDLVFQAPSMRFPNVELPPTADILIHTTDRDGKAVGEVTLTGFGRPSGRLSLVTDLAGNGWARNLPLGRYKVSARNEQGLRASMTLVVEDKPGQEFYIAVR